MGFCWQKTNICQSGKLKPIYTISHSGTRSGLFRNVCEQNGEQTYELHLFNFFFGDKLRREYIVSGFFMQNPVLIIQRKEIFKWGIHVFNNNPKMEHRCTSSSLFLRIITAFISGLYFWCVNYFGCWIMALTIRLVCILYWECICIEKNKAIRKNVRWKYNL